MMLSHLHYCLKYPKAEKYFFSVPSSTPRNSCSLKTELGQQLNSEPSCLVLIDENNLHCFDS